METNSYVEDWLSAVAETPKTESSYRGQIRIFSEFARARGKNFEDTVKTWRRAKRTGFNEREEFIEDWEDLVRGFHTRIKKQYAPLSVKNLLATAKSFFKFWNIPIRVRLPKHACVIYHNKDLTKDDVYKILTSASPRNRVMWLIMAESGMRGETCVRLKYWQIKEDFEAGRIPMKILLPSASLKDRVGDRWTFLGADGYRQLKEYLARRKPLKDEDYVFTSEKPGRMKGEQFTVASISGIFSKTVSKLGLDDGSRGLGKPKSIRMHGLRNYFRNNIKADSAYINFWMGHSLGVDAHYISRNLEKHRTMYKEGYERLRVYTVAEANEMKEIVEQQAQEIERLKKTVLNMSQKRLTDEEWTLLSQLLKNVAKGKWKFVKEKPDKMAAIREFLT